MAVKITIEPESGDIREDCIICGKATRMWWGDGCAPLCSRCASRASHAEMVALSRKHGLGPIPEDSTDPDAN